MHLLGAGRELAPCRRPPMVRSFRSKGVNPDGGELLFVCACPHESHPCGRPNRSRSGGTRRGCHRPADPPPYTQLPRTGTHHAASNGNGNGAAAGAAEEEDTRHAAATKGGQWQSEMLLYVNGQRRALKHAPPEMTLLQYLRQAGLTGTKLGCGEVGGWVRVRLGWGLGGACRLWIWQRPHDSMVGRVGSYISYPIAILMHTHTGRLRRLHRDGLGVGPRGAQAPAHGGQRLPRAPRLHGRLRGHHRGGYVRARRLDGPTVIRENAGGWTPTLTHSYPHTSRLHQGSAPSARGSTRCSGASRSCTGRSAGSARRAS